MRALRALAYGFAILIALGCSVTTPHAQTAPDRWYYYCMAESSPGSRPHLWRYITDVFEGPHDSTLNNKYANEFADWSFNRASAHGFTQIGTGRGGRMCGGGPDTDTAEKRRNEDIAMYENSNNDGHSLQYELTTVHWVPGQTKTD